MGNDVCKKIEKCPIFVKGVLANKYTGVAYRKLYCLLPGKYKNCKRYLASEQTGRPVPENIMPNSNKPLDEIVRIVNSK
ncbi:MAG: hypothetical protein II951_12705 [Bacteroidales bacterium]|nr:hypothetical protein [Bacteroidales bacterium]